MQAHVANQVPVRHGIHVYVQIALCGLLNTSRKWFGYKMRWEMFKCNRDNLKKKKQLARFMGHVVLSLMIMIKVHVVHAFGEGNVARALFLATLS